MFGHVELLLLSVSLRKIDRVIDLVGMRDRGRKRMEE